MNTCVPDPRRRNGPEDVLAGLRIVYLVTEDWYFWSHRLPLARAARDAGAQVCVACRFGTLKDRLRAEGFETVEMPFDRSGLNPLRDMALLLRILRFYRRHKPDLVHHVAVKPALYGTLAARLAGVRCVVNAMAGLGFLFISESRKANWMRRGFLSLFSRLSNHASTRLIVQNADDLTVLIENGVAADQTAIIRGSGVDLEAFPQMPEASGAPVAVCVARMLSDKGIYELVGAARLLQARGAGLRVRLVGSTDDNPSSVSLAQLETWHREGVVDYAGFSDNVAEEYAHAHIAVLPSYREGLPKSLLEAAACGRPMVATDVPGCREICRPDETGILVPKKIIEELAAALETLANDPALRQRMGARARALVEEVFSTHVICTQTMKLYADLLGATRGDRADPRE